MRFQRALYRYWLCTFFYRELSRLPTSSSSSIQQRRPDETTTTPAITTYSCQRRTELSHLEFITNLPKAQRGELLQVYQFVREVMAHTFSGRVDNEGS